jgi:hypothetical protein
LVIVEDTYIVYWFGGCFLFVGSSVVACCCLVQLCKVEDLRLRLDLLVLVACFCLLQLCRVGVLHAQLELFFFTLRGPGVAPTIRPALLSFIVSE